MKAENIESGPVRIAPLTLNPGGEKTMEELRAQLSSRPDQVLESLAAENNLSLLQVVLCLPQQNRAIASGSHFIRVMEDIAAWARSR